MSRDFPSSPVVMTPCFQCRQHGCDSQSGTKIPHLVCGVAKKRLQAEFLRKHKLLFMRKKKKADFQTKPQCNLRGLGWDLETCKLLTNLVALVRDNYGKKLASISYFLFELDKWMMGGTE